MQPITNNKNVLNKLTDIVARQARRYGCRPAVDFIDENGGKSSLSWTEIDERVNAVAAALETLGLEPQQAVAVFSANRPEILFTDFACYANRAIPVSIYSTSSESQVEYIVNDADCRYIFVGDQRQYEIARKVLHNSFSLERIILMSDHIKTAKGDCDSMKFSSLLELGRKASDMCRKAVESRRSEASADDIATLIYTSGTTGEPKGAVLPHSCFNAVIDMHVERLTMLSDSDTSLCFLPLSHIFEKAWTYFCLYMGMHVTINENPKEIAKAGDGIYVNGASPSALSDLENQLDKLQKSEFSSVNYTAGAEQFPTFAVLAFLFLLIDVFVVERKISWLKGVNFFTGKK